MRAPRELLEGRKTKTPVVVRGRAQSTFLGWLFWLLSMVSLLLAGALYCLSRPAAGRVPLDLETGLLILGVSAIASCVEFVSGRLLLFRIALGARLLSLLLLTVCTAGEWQIEALLLVGAVVEVSIYERYPANLVINGVFVAVAVAFRFYVWIAGIHRPWSASLPGQAGLLLTGALAAVPAGLFTRYREQIIAMLDEERRLNSMIAEMTAMNLQYQRSAAEASEAGMRDERLRITRDIHDIVGYTLTNNIAVMEAATDMLRRNPLGVPSLLNAARDNAREGLEQIRRALYQLRAQEENLPVGLRALKRLCTLFEKATRIEVRLGYGNARWEYGESIDSAIYHLVQESLLNAFRHGRPAHVTVALWEGAGDIAVTIADDGGSPGSYAEGIGLRGMRERVEGLGGEVQIDAQSKSFIVLARIPLKGVSCAG